LHKKVSNLLVFAEAYAENSIFRQFLLFFDTHIVLSRQKRISKLEKDHRNNEFIVLADIVLSGDF
jgi:hypothetical protein